MTAGAVRAREWLLSLSASVAVVSVLGLTTNHLDTDRFRWDHDLYVRMAEEGLRADGLVSPFAFRWVHTLLAGALSDLGLSTFTAFAAIAWVGCVGQLVSIERLVRWLTGSTFGGWIGFTVVALSLFNVKFVLFDVYRPDASAYWLVSLGTYLAIRGRLVPLLAVTALGLQVREFTVIPLLALLVADAMEKRWRALPRWALAGSVVVVSVVVPRLVIPVSKHNESLFTPNYLTGWSPERELNLVYAVVCYALPLLALVTPTRVRVARERLGEDRWRFLTAFSVICILMSWPSGSDMNRFVTYLFVPVAVGSALLGLQARRLELVLVAIGAFVFNRVAWEFPQGSVQEYLDFWGGYALDFGTPRLLRFAEVVAWVLLVQAARVLMDADRDLPRAGPVPARDVPD